MLNLFLNNDFFRTNLLRKDNRNIYQIDTPTFKIFMKKLYCPKTMNSESSFDDVRKATMLSKHKKQNTELVYSRSLRSGQLWLPPESAIERIADIINMQTDYLYTTGNPMDLLPNFLGKDCLRKTEDNEVEYYFGPDSKGNVSEISGQKRRMENTPQKGRRKKRMTTSTPVKSK
ncbi:unnamed protein product [Mytilus coruscus]|uniref:Uncharacterized protein n=1 Tax=Mytilus coruscus TaxID=42192 RepID=A0A6J8DAS7_MYTCO|nr:unnamed protein product [Mytilus coruscus]